MSNLTDKSRDETGLPVVSKCRSKNGSQAPPRDRGVRVQTTQLGPLAANEPQR